MLMATIVRKPTSQFWFAAFRDGGGRQRRKSTGTTDKKRAQRIAEQYETTAKRKGDPRKVREAFASLYKEFYGEDLPSTTVREFANRWLKDRARETSLSTITIYERTLSRLLDFLGPDADRDIASVSQNKVADFRNRLADGRAAATVNRDLRVVKMLFRKARLDPRPVYF